MTILFPATEKLSEAARHRFEFQHRGRIEFGCMIIEVRNDYYQETSNIQPPQGRKLFTVTPARAVLDLSLEPLSQAGSQC